MADCFMARGGFVCGTLTCSFMRSLHSGRQRCVQYCHPYRETSFVDKPYEKTEIGDEVQLVELSSNRFRYPDGYWASANQVGTLPQPAALPPQVFKPVTSAGSLAAPTPFPLPSPSPGATTVPSPVAIQSPSQTVAQASASSTPGQKATVEEKPGGQKLTPEQAQVELEKPQLKIILTCQRKARLTRKP